MTRKPHVWVIEMYCSRQWKPCRDAHISREDARRRLVTWRSVFPDDKFRIAPYVRSK